MGIMNDYVAPDPESVRRLVQAHQRGAEEELIASAYVEAGRLIVWSCEPKRYEVTVAEVPIFAGLDDERLRCFEVSTSGSRIHWSDGDIDVSLDTIREYADPVAWQQRRQAASKR